MVFEYIVNHAPESITKRLEALKLHRERPDFHPEESTYEHIRIVTTRCIRANNPHLVMCGVLHDIMKKDTAKINPPEHKMAGYPTSPGHDSASASLIRNDLEIQTFIKKFQADVDIVEWLVSQHMRIAQIGQMRQGKQDAFRAMPHFRLLEAFHVADNMLVSDDEAFTQMMNILKPE